MKENKVLSICILTVNAIGVLLLVWFAVLYLAHSPVVPNPDAMLPMARWEGAGWLMTVGLVPMLAANVLGFLFPLREVRPLALRLLIFLPSLVQLALVLHFFVTSLQA